MMLYEENFRSRIKYFALIWLVPFIAILAAINEQLNGAEETWFNEAFVIWVFLVANLPVMYGWVSGRIPAREIIVFWWILPFILWVGLVLLKLVILG